MKRTIHLAEKEQKENMTLEAENDTKARPMHTLHINCCARGYCNAEICYGEFDFPTLLSTMVLSILTTQSRLTLSQR